MAGSHSRNYFDVNKNYRFPAEMLVDKADQFNFDANSELRAVAEVSPFDNSHEGFINDFVKAWSKVMTLDRTDL